METSFVIVNATGLVLPTASGNRPASFKQIIGETHGTRLAYQGAMQQTPDAPHQSLADDILYGANEIAAFLFGGRRFRRRVYNLADNSGLPVFRIGANICARKSILMAWIADQEANSGFSSGAPEF